MQYFSYLDKRDVFQQEYSQPPILPSPHFRWVVNGPVNFLIITSNSLYELPEDIASLKCADSVDILVFNRFKTGNENSVYIRSYP